MIEKIEFLKYKRLENLEINLGSGLISIMGTNGTCKSSLLYIISNSYKEIENNSDFFTDVNCMKTIKKVNQVINPKIEKLNKGDREYNDPAIGYSGNYYECTYADGKVLKFRKHNQEEQYRYRIIPKYDKGSNEKLPYGLVIYLGLGRLYSYGEYANSDNLLNLKYALPERYQKELLKSYEDFTGYKIDQLKYEQMGDVKKRGIFSTNMKGIDSNTISAGEDNLMIILNALYSLKYFAESLKPEYHDVPGILLIDELDATLHPEFQIKLISLFDTVCKDYKNLNIVFTTHSINVLEECSRRKNKIIYLSDNVKKVGVLDEVNEFTIRAALENKIDRDYFGKKIPILTEDEEARDFLNVLLEYFSTTEPYENKCARAINRLKPVDSTFSSEALKKLFVDSKIDRRNLSLIGVVDGDKTSMRNLSSSLISLPGSSCPENIAFNMCQFVIENQDDSKVSDFIYYLNHECGCTLRYINTKIIKEIADNNALIERKKSNKESTHGIQRDINKKLYNRHKEILIEMFKFWVRYDENRKQVDKFYNDLKVCFKQNAPYYGISSTYWED